MRNLSELERAFSRRILAGEAAVATEIEAAGTLGAGDRLEIYAHAYRARLVEALARDFPGLRALVGDEGFDCLCESYLSAHPSDRPSLRWLGRRMAEFLARDDAYAAHPVLAEMAAFEWALCGAFDAVDDPVADRVTLAAHAPEDWPALRPRLHGSVRLVPMRWNVPPLWLAAKGDVEGSSTPALLDEPAVCLVWRKGLVTRFRGLDACEAAALDAVRRGDDLAGVCETIGRWTPDEEVPARVAALLDAWFADELVSSVAPPVAS